MAPEHDQLELPGDPSAPRVARRHVGALLRAWGIDTVLEDATLLVSELVSNAVLHGAGSPCLAVSRRGRVVRFSVSDGGGRAPQRRAARKDHITGRGLELVDAIAHRWGSHVDRHGTEVWFELRIDAPRRGARR